MVKSEFIQENKTFGERFCLQEYYPEDREAICRFMYFWQFMYIVYQRKLYFSRGDKFKDPYEGLETELSRKIRRAVHDNAAFQSNSDYYDRNRRSVAISCWYIGDKESREMWEQFAPSPDGIAVRSTVDRLKKALSKHNEKICIRKIEYIENHENEFTKFGCPFYPFSIKRNRDFGYESEVRAIYGDGKACKPESPLYNASELVGTGIELEVDPSILIDVVILSPKAPDWFYCFIKSIISCLNIELEVKKSTLREE